MYPTDSKGYFHVAKLGTGDGDGGAVVYKSICYFTDGPSHSGIVAVKKIRAVRDLQPVEVHHANIHRVHCVFHEEETDTTFIVMPYVCSAQGLILARRHGLQERTVAALLREVLRGLAFLHSHNIYHRDLKPTNVLLDLEGEVKIADTRLSLSHYNENPPRSYWSAPESQYSMSKDDIYSIGVLALELAYGNSPTFFPTAKRLIGDDESRFSPNMKVFVCSCLKPNPAERPEAEQLLTYPFFLDCLNTPSIQRLVNSVFKKLVHPPTPSVLLDSVGPIDEYVVGAINEWVFCKKEFKFYPKLCSCDEPLSQLVKSSPVREDHLEKELEI